MPRSTWFALLLGSFLLVIAGGMHACSELPLEYSWSRTVELFWQAILDTYFVLMALVVLLAATLSHPRARQEMLPWRLTHFLLASILTFSIACLLLEASASYSLWDRLCLFPAALLLLYSLRDRHLGTALLGLFSTVFILVLISYVFTIFKSQLFVRGVLFDEWLIAGEKMAFGKPLYLIIANWAKENPAVVSFSDWVYYLFFHHMALVALFLFARGAQTEQWRYVTTLSLCYLIGGLSYYLFPAMGPVYHDPNSFSYLQSGAPLTAEIQSFLLNSTDSSIEGTLTKIDTFAFIACMPSLHMAHESIMLYYSRQSPLMLVFSGLFWISSCAAVLVLGWHYAFDVLGGLVLAALVIACSRK